MKKLVKMVDFLNSTKKQIAVLYKYLKNKEKKKQKPDIDNMDVILNYLDKEMKKHPEDIIEVDIEQLERIKDLIE